MECDVTSFAPMLIGRRLVLANRCYDQLTSLGLGLIQTSGLPWTLRLHKARCKSVRVLVTVLCRCWVCTSHQRWGRCRIALFFFLFSRSGPHPGDCAGTVLGTVLWLCCVCAGHQRRDQPELRHHFWIISHTPFGSMPPPYAPCKMLYRSTKCIWNMRIVPIGC